ncbi:hypothetical protein JCM17380_29280 [Desulfosporosinus burensis]
MAKVSSDFRHTAGEFVMGRSVAIGSFRRHEVFLWGGWLGDTHLMKEYKISCLEYKCEFYHV